MQRLQLQYDKEIAFIEEQQRSAARRYSPQLAPASRCGLAMCRGECTLLYVAGERWRRSGKSCSWHCRRTSMRRKRVRLQPWHSAPS